MIKVRIQRNRESFVKPAIEWIMVVRRRRDGTLHRQAESGLVRVKSTSTCLKRLFDLCCSNNLKDQLRAVLRGL
jgi:hypothetical protein